MGCRASRRRARLRRLGEKATEHLSVFPRYCITERPRKVHAFFSVAEHAPRFHVFADVVDARSEERSTIAMHLITAGSNTRGEL